MSLKALRPLLLGVSTFAIAACDSSSAYEDCAYAEDPAAASGSRRLACMASMFAAEGPRARDVGGVVRRGEDVVPGATVRVEPTPGFALSQGAASASTVTDAVGAYLVRTAALRYDMLIRLPGGPEEEVLTLRGIGFRYIEPSVEGMRSFGRAWRSRVEVKLDRPILPGRSLAFFASGEGVYAVSGELTTGLTFLARDYELPARLHVVEYDTTGGLEAATATGRADVELNAGAARLVNVALKPIEQTFEPKFAVTLPSGFTATAVEVRFGFTRTSGAHLATIPIGTSRKLPVIPEAGTNYRVVATGDGATVDTGETSFDGFSPLTAVALAAPPVVVTPLEGETRSAGETLLTDGAGVFEHMLVPQAGGPSLRIITAQREAMLPDTTVVGAPRASGAYTWTVRNFPKMRFAEELGGVDVRRYRAMVTSRPRTIVLR